MKKKHSTSMKVTEPSVSINSIKFTAVIKNSVLFTVSEFLV